MAWGGKNNFLPSTTHKDQWGAHTWQTWLWFHYATIIFCSTNVASLHGPHVSMHPTFGTNDVNFHLFTLMVFDAHHTKIPVTWIITSCQTCNKLVEWLNPLKAKLQGKMLEWKSSCFIIDDGPQELQTLWWVFFSIHHFILLCTCNHVKFSFHIIHV
jgi:hypothetical protein